MFRSPHDIISEQIGETNCLHFYEWAFGDSFSASLRMIDVLALWNERHAHKFSALDEVLPSLIKMTELYLLEESYANMA